MGRKASILFLSLILLSAMSCSNCDSYIQRPAEELFFQLFDPIGNDLWFGPSHPYEPDSANVFVINQGVRRELDTRVQSNSSSVRYVAWILPATPSDQGRTVIHLSETDSVDFFYRTVTDQANCEEFIEVSFILQGDSVICSRCGIPEIDGGRGEYIRLLK